MANADARLGYLERSAKELKDQLAAVTSAVASGAKSTPDADLADTNARWNQQLERLLEGAAHQASERITRESEGYLRGLEEQLQQRIRALGTAFS